MCRPLLLAAAVVAAVAALAFPEAAAQTCACPTPATQQNFDANQYLGDWYEMKRVPRNFEDDGQCGMAHYTLADAATTTINVLNTNYVPSSDSVGAFHLTATAVDANNGKFGVTFPGSTRPPSKYWVLGTDYSSYAVVYSCTDPDGTSTVTPPITLWVLSKDPAKYTAEVDKKAMAIITAAGLDPSILHTVDHTAGCPIAACRACSVTVSPLDLAKLKGRWWEVQHSPYATGSDKQSCNMATFTSTSDGVTFNGTTYAMSSATAGADKTLLLEAKWSDANTKAGEFKINNSEGKLCVVGTDYDNWAVVSICVPPNTMPTTTPAAGRPTPTSAVSGGVYVLSRKRGLSAAKQLDANKAVTNAGIPAASMQATASTPCPAAALADASGSAASAALTPAVLLLSVLTAVLGRLRPAQ